MDGKSVKDDRSYTLCEDSELSSEYEFVPTPAESDCEENDLPFRSRPVECQRDVKVEIHQAPERDGILVSITPPKEPERGLNSRDLKHVPCDIVLTIDVSGSMSTEAPPPAANPEDAERNGLTVLDLVKHAARTILETLDETDRLAIVTFSTDAKVVQRLLPMTIENKALALKNINSLQPESMTNLWHGILESIKIFDNDERSNCVPAIMILTDGLPNHMCPNQGYVKKIRSYKLPAALHTFGFGYSLRSGLLKSIAEIGGGNYAFIPDSGMLGTVFIHAVANLQSTFATRVSLTLTTSDGLTAIETMGGRVSRVEDKSDLESETEDGLPVKVVASLRLKSPPRKKKRLMTTLTIPLDDIKYGQSRDIFLEYHSRTLYFHDPKIQFCLTGQPVDGTLLNVAAEQAICTNNIPAAKFAYHRARAEICLLISSIFPLNRLEEHQVTSDASLTELCAKVDCLASRIENQGYTDPANLSLIEDLAGQDPSGQIRLALSSTEYFERWGKHYLLSILNAHQKQICNSFKDNGPLQYGRDSPLFNMCRDALDKAFDSLPAPTPSAPAKDKKGQPKFSRVDMRKYHRRDNPCFAGECRITMGNGNQLAVQDLRRNMEVRTQKGTAKVCAVVATKVQAAPLSVVGTLRITPWHPIFAGGAWSFPADVAERSELYGGVIFSVLLERNDNPEAHTVEVEGQWATTLGHGITAMESDVRAHEFFGNYNLIVGSLNRLLASEGVLICAGLRRNPANGLACGFRPAVELSTEEKRSDNDLSCDTARIAVKVV